MCLTDAYFFGGIMKIRHLFNGLSKYERGLWLCSSIIIISSFVLSSSTNYLSLIASLIGVSALIFVAKGYVIGQILTVVFSIFYGIISFYFQYYGEMITYLGMTSPIAILTVISWIKNPYGKTSEVAVNQMSKRQIAVMLSLSAVVTIIFYFILKELDTANLLISTISITTSFLASYLTLMRSSYYAVAYMANDVVLIILWVLATIMDRAYLPMIICFIMFLINDLYGFINWQKMKKRQSAY